MHLVETLYAVPSPNRHQRNFNNSCRLSPRSDARARAGQPKIRNSPRFGGSRAPCTYDSILKRIPREAVRDVRPRAVGVARYRELSRLHAVASELIPQLSDADVELIFHQRAGLTLPNFMFFECLSLQKKYIHVF